MTQRSPDIIFITGAPGALAMTVAERLLEGGTAVLALLVEDPQQRELEGRFGVHQHRVRFVAGSLRRIDCGLTGPDYLELADEVTAILHLELPTPPAASGESEQARGAAREIIELALAAKQLRHVVLLSHLDVAGDFIGTFAEHDLDLGQSPLSPDQDDRLRAERIYRRFVQRLPLTVARAGWITGSGDGLCPLSHLLLAVDDLPQLLGKVPEQALPCIELEPLAEILAGLAAFAPSEAGQTLHLAASPVHTVTALSEALRAAVAPQLPAGLDLAAAARRSLRVRGDGAAWVPRDFFKRLPSRARFASHLTARFLAEHGLSLPALDEVAVARIASHAVEEFTGFK